MYGEIPKWGPELAITMSVFPKCGRRCTTTGTLEVAIHTQKSNTSAWEHTSDNKSVAACLAYNCSIPQKGLKSTIETPNILKVKPTIARLHRFLKQWRPNFHTHNIK